MKYILEDYQLWSIFIKSYWCYKSSQNFHSSTALLEIVDQWWFFYHYTGTLEWQKWRKLTENDDIVSGTWNASQCYKSSQDWCFIAEIVIYHSESFLLWLSIDMISIKRIRLLRIFVNKTMFLMSCYKCIRKFAF